MTSQEEFEAFVTQNRELIERMIDLQKGVAIDLVDKEREIVKDAYGHARTYDDEGKRQAEEMAHAFIGAITDPEIQKHFMNMGLEFFMGVSAIMARAPIPDFVKEGYDSTRSNMRDTACRANTECGSKKSEPTYQKVNISVDEDSRRDVPDDVFKHGE